VCRSFPSQHAEIAANTLAHELGAFPMTATDLRSLVARPGANDVLYEDAHLPGRPVLLRSACPQNVSPRTPVLFVHHGDLRNGGEFRDFWRPLVDEA
jgi:hypothetical protein